MRNRSWYVSRMLLLLYFAGLCICCFWKFDFGPETDPLLFGIEKDKIAHFLLFFPFPALCFFTFGNLRNTPEKFLKFFPCVLVAGAAVGGGIELLQGISDYRSCDIRDFAADCIGLVACASIIYFHEAFFRKW